ncbi:MAG: fibrobacter succinogenes major paralogous domain-containing protein [Bacteroidota bacterium]
MELNNAICNTPGVKGICPTGWYIPTDPEWTTLTAFLGGISVAGGKMKSTGTIEAGTGLWYAPNTGATNESGFTAIPGGDLNDSKTFGSMGMHGRWWSSSEDGPFSAWIRIINPAASEVSRGSINKLFGYSLRCVRNF